MVKRTPKFKIIGAREAKQLKELPDAIRTPSFDCDDISQAFQLPDGRLLIVNTEGNRVIQSIIWASKEILLSELARVNELARQPPRHWINQWLPDAYGFVAEIAERVKQLPRILGAQLDLSRPSKGLIKKVDAAMRRYGEDRWTDAYLGQSLCAAAGEFYIATLGGHWAIINFGSGKDGAAVPVILQNDGNRFSPFQIWDEFVSGDLLEYETVRSRPIDEPLSRLAGRPFYVLCLAFYDRLPQ